MQKNDVKSTGVVVVSVRVFNSPAWAPIQRGCCAVRKTMCCSEESGALLGTGLS